jgi:hypothetical protein
LQQRDSLPHPQEIPSLFDRYGNEPILLREQVTVGDMLTHVGQSNDASREIGVTVFDGASVITLGKEHSVTPHPLWRAVEEGALASIHTHPGDRSPINHTPSIDDLKIAQKTDTPHLVISQKGLMLCPTRQEYDTLPTWREHALTALGFSAGGAHSPEAVNIAQKEYVENVLHLRVIPWEVFPPDFTLQQAIAQTVEWRAQQLAQEGQAAPPIP